MFVFQLAQLNHLNCYKFTCQLVHSQVYLTKGPITNLFDKFVEIKASWREFLVFSHVLFVIFNNFISLFHDFLIELLMLTFIEMFLSLMYRPSPCCSC